MDHAILQDTIDATFKRRDTPIPQDEPLGLSIGLAGDRMKQQQ